MPDRFIIRGGRILDVATGVDRPADLLIDGTTIAEIGPPEMIAPVDAKLIDATDRLLLPGLINAHTHSHGGLAKGMVADRVPLEVFLASSAGLYWGRTLTDKYLSALISAVELVRKGCTATYDMFVEIPVPTRDGAEAVAQAYHDVGMRAVVAPMMADRTLYQAMPGLIDAMPDQIRRQVEKITTAPQEASIEGCRTILKHWPFDRDRVRPAVAPTIPLHCTDEFLSACGDLARDFDVGMQTHLAESKTQALIGLRKYGKTLTAHLSDLGLLGPRFSAAHAIWVDREDILRMADAGAGVSHNVLSNLRLGSGMAPVRLMIENGLQVGIGTDATNTSDTQNMFEAMRLAAYISRIQAPEYDQWLSIEDVIAMATTGSAAILGFADRIGRLETGYKADIVFLNLADITYVPANNIALQLVNGESGGAVDSVMIGGRMVLEHGRMLTVDEAKLRIDIEKASARLNVSNARNATLARSIADIVGAFCVSHSRMPLPIHRRAETCGA
ncbi:MAG: amidohydrolase family protein [Alphaproteobacteria bacterium]|nr:amidohydrolase family protein [Alphaproteobacteria bacterium]